MRSAPIRGPEGRAGRARPGSRCRSSGSGSPWPWKTTPVTGRSGDSRLTVSTCSTISQGSRLRRKPRRPVSQKRAAERAADLRGDAHAAARLLERDPHRLEDAPVAGAEEVLDEGVDDAAPAVDDLEPVEPSARRRSSAAQAFDRPRTPSRSSRSSPTTRCRTRRATVERQAGEGRGQALGRLRRAGAGRASAYASRLPARPSPGSEAEDAALAADLDLDLGLADAQDADAVEAVALADEAVVDERDRLARRAR